MTVCICPEGDHPGIPPRYVAELRRACEAHEGEQPMTDVLPPLDAGARNFKEGGSYPEAFDTLGILARFGDFYEC